MSSLWTRKKALLLAVLVMLVALVRISVEQVPDLIAANLTNPDSYYKLVLLQDYSLATGFQFVARDNAPDGNWMHWSLPHTWTIWQLHRGLMVLGLERDQALLWAGGGLTMLSMLLLAWLVALAVIACGSRRAAVMSALVLAMSAPLFGYGRLLQITHHIFMLLPLAAAAALFFAQASRQRPWHDALGGALLALALWISPETMPMVVALTAIRACMRLQYAESGRVWPVGVGLLTMLLLAWHIDPPPPTFSAWALDHVSQAWLLLAAGLLLLCLLTDVLADRRLRLWLSVPLLALVMGALALGWLLVVPGALAGPAGLIPQELHAVWWDQIQELQPIRKPSQWVSYLVMPVAAWLLLTRISLRQRSLWMFALAQTALAYGVLAALHIRMGAAASVVTALAFGVGLSGLRAMTDEQGDVPLRAQWLPAGLILLAPIQLFLMVALVQFENAGEQKDICQLKAIAPVLRTLPPSVFLLPISDGPELLYRTHHRTIAGNYHHNISGILDVYRAWLENDEAKVGAIIERRRIGYVLGCTASSYKTGMGMRIRQGDAPAWLKPVPLDGANEGVKTGAGKSGWRLYRVMPQ